MERGRAGTWLLVALLFSCFWHLGACWGWIMKNHTVSTPAEGSPVHDHPVYDHPLSTDHLDPVNSVVRNMDYRRQASPPPPDDAPPLTFEGTPVPPRIPLEFAQTEPLPEELTSSSFVEPGHPGPGFLAMCLVARDAHEDILEWLEHHKRLGVSKVYVWDNHSTPPMNATLRAHIDAGFVDYTYFVEFEHPTGAPQLYAYDACLAQARNMHDWMAFIDVDEFLMFRGGGLPIRSLPQFLTRFMQGSALAVHWILFGSSGHERRPASGTLRSYVRCLPLRHSQHQLVKSIVRVPCTEAAWSPHAFRHNCTDAPTLRTDGSVIEGPRGDRPVHDALVLHHYATKSRAEFATKMARGSGMRRQRGWEYFMFVDSWSVDWNLDALRVWDDADTRGNRHPRDAARAARLYKAEAHQDHWLRGP